MFLCRFCIKGGKRGGFSLRPEKLLHAHLASAREHGQNCCGVKTTCVLAESLLFFEVTAGFPPDLAHELFEGIVPISLAECFSLLV